MRWLVTGSAGFIGSRLMDSIGNKAEGCDIEAGCNACGATMRLSANMRTRTDVIAHLAATSGIAACKESPGQAIENNLESTINVLDEATFYEDRQATVLFASSAAAATPEKSLYAATKAASEHIISAYRTEYGLKAGILRLGNVYGPGSLTKDSCIASFCKQALSSGRIKVEGSGKQTRQFVHVDDVVKAFKDMPDGVWSVHPYEETEINIVAEMVANLSGADIVHVNGRPNDIKRPKQTADILPIDYTGLWTGIQETWDYFVMAVERK